MTAPTISGTSNPFRTMTDLPAETPKEIDMTLNPATAYWTDMFITMIDLGSTTAQEGDVNMAAFFYEQAANATYMLDQIDPLG